MYMRNFLIRSGILGLSTPVLLTACTTYRDIPANAPYAQVEKVMGKPTTTCPLPDGKTKLSWNQQPMGHYGYAAVMDANGNVEQVYDVFSTENQRRLDSGEWTKERVYCEFGEPAFVDRAGLAEKNEEIWNYYYQQNNLWNMVLFLYMGRDGQKLTHYGSGMDTRYEDGFFNF